MADTTEEFTDFYGVESTPKGFLVIDGRNERPVALRHTRRPAEAIARARAFGRDELDAAGQIRQRFIAGRAASVVRGVGSAGRPVRLRIRAIDFAGRR